MKEGGEVHVLTIEDPIEYLVTSKKAVINQREVGIDVRDWSVALKHAVRQDPDVILGGASRDRDTFEGGLQGLDNRAQEADTSLPSCPPSRIAPTQALVLSG